MDYRIEEAKYIGNYVIWLKFRDGLSGEVDLANELRGVIFQPLRDKEYFKSFYIHPEIKNLSWKNGADFSPEYLYNSVKKAA